MDQDNYAECPRRLRLLFLAQLQPHVETVDCGRFAECDAWHGVHWSNTHTREVYRNWTWVATGKPQLLGELRRTGTLLHQ
jgi:hypothetical protein